MLRRVFILLVLFAMGCHTEERVGTVSLAQQQAVRIGEGATFTPVGIDWTVGNLMGQAHLLHAVVTNFRGAATTVHVFAFAMGLDQRTATRDLGSFPLGPAGSNGETVNFDVPVSQLPIQSTSAEAEVELHAVVDEGTPSERTIPSTPLFYEFPGKGHGTATFFGWEGKDFSVQSANPFPTVSQLLSDMTSSVLAMGSVSGRFWDGSTWRDAAKAPPSPNNPSGVGQTYQFRGPRAGHFQSFIGQLGPPPGSHNSIQERLCSRWLVEYVDAGLGESVLTTKGPFNVQARRAHFLITTPNATPVAKSLVGLGVLTQAQVNFFVSEGIANGVAR